MRNTFLNHRIAARSLSGGIRKKIQQYVALVMFGALAASAVAQDGVTQAPLTYDDGDLFLGFRSTDGTSDYLVNIGQPGQFLTGSSFQVPVGNMVPDLVVAFGADWYTRIDPNTGRNAVLWAVVGGRQIGASGDPDNTLYSTNPVANPWPRRSDTAQSFTTSLFAGMGNSFSGNQPTPNNPKGLIQSAASTNSYASYQPGGANSGGVSFQTWNPWNEAGPSTVLYFDRIIPGSGPSTALGFLNLSSGGQLNFTAGGGASPTPPPSPTPAASPTATASGTPGASPTPSPTGTPLASPTPTPPTGTPTPSATPASQAVNLSTRMRVLTGENVGIGGFIISGTVPKHVLLRTIGPSLTQFGVPDALPDTVLELHGPGTFVTVINDNWRDDPAQETAILATGLAPGNNLESAIDATLSPGAYTAIVKGKNNAVGAALIEVYDLNQTVAAKLGNISTRAFVSTGDNIVIAGFVLGGGSGTDRIVVRGIGPSLIPFGVANALANPKLELRNNNGVLLVMNNDWQDDSAQAAELTAAGLAPTNPLEAGIAATLSPGLYTALLSGLDNGTGVGVVEAYDRGAP
jgi:hypothetical protein